MPNGHSLHSEASAHLARFSQVILEIYRLAREEPLESFSRNMMDNVQSLVAFDSAWWGRTAFASVSPDYLHSSYMANLPDGYLEDWYLIRERDNTVDLATEHPGSAVALDIMNDDITDGLRQLGQQYNFRYIGCVMQYEDVSSNTNHLSLYRSETSGNFDEIELMLLENLIPHLVSASVINMIRNTHIMAMGSTPGQQYALAVSNDEGLLHSAEAGLVALLNREWPQWHGPRLPFNVSDSAAEQIIRGCNIAVEVRKRDHHYLIMARPLMAIERLTAREMEIATQFGDGKTYLTISEDLGISPNTVRYYIRSIYTKLNVNNKAGLVHVIHHG